MRFMLLVKASNESEAGVMPSAELVAAGEEYIREAVRAGILIAADGLYPSSSGARVKFSGGTITVIDGPFTETKELIGGYWLIDVKSLEEAVEWARRSPMGEADAEIEVRQVFEAGATAEEDAASEIAMREEVQRKYSER